MFKRSLVNFSFLTSLLLKQYYCLVFVKGCLSRNKCYKEQLNEFNIFVWWIFQSLEYQLKGLRHMSNGVKWQTHPENISLTNVLSVMDVVWILVLEKGRHNSSNLLSP